MGAGPFSRLRDRVPGLFLAAAVAWTVAAGFSTPAPAAEGDAPAPVTLPVLVPGVTLPPVTLPPVTLPPISIPPLTVPNLTVLQPPTAGPAPVGASTGPTAAAPDASPASAGAASPPVATDAPAAASAPASPSQAGPAGAVASTGPASQTTPAVTGPLPLRLRNAAAETAQRLSFPLGLAAAILVFLILQPRLDRGDTSVAHAGAARDDDLIGFS